MENKQTLGSAVSNFEQQFKRFQDSGNKPPEFLLPKKRAAEAIARVSPSGKEAKGKKIVLQTYGQFLAPEQSFGDYSAITQQIEDDKKLLVQA